MAPEASAALVSFMCEDQPTRSLGAAILSREAMNTSASSLPGNAPLIDYAVKGLEKCWLPRHRRWSHIYHLDGRAEPNESLPPSDVFYTLNVLLGLSRVSRVPSDLDLRAIFEHNTSLLTRLPVAKYAFGMALWT